MKRNSIAIVAAASLLVLASLACAAVTSTEEPTQSSSDAATQAPAEQSEPTERSAPTGGTLMPVLEDADATNRIIESGDYTTLYDLKNETSQDETFKPDVERYTVDMTTATQIDLTAGWCARTAAIRDDNRRHFDPAVTIGDYLVPDRDLEYFEWETDDGMFCFSWDIVASNWPVGEHRVTESFTYDAAINDGWEDFAAGEYISEYRVSVSEGATASSGPASGGDECLAWDEVTVSMKGETVCFRGIITKFDQSRQLGTRYSFSDDSDAVFVYSVKYEIIDPNTGKTIAPGTCVEVTGPIRVEGERPAVYLDPIMDDDSGDSGYFNFYDDAASCQ